MRHYILFISLFIAIGTQAQQINPVPDYVFRNQMSVGRNAVTDTAAYISIGPRYGANKGLMPPIVSDTAAITGVKRNGLLIFSVQRNNFQYWDSINSRWTSVTANVDTTIISTRAWRKKGDDSLGAVIATRTDTTLLSTRAWRQKGLDSLAAIEIDGSGTVNYVPKFTATRTLGNSVLFESSSNILLNTTTNIGGYRLQVNHNAGNAMALVNEQTTGSTQNVSLRLATHDGSSVTVGSYLAELSGSWNSSNFLGGNYPGSTALQNTRANGLSLIASNANGNIRFYTGGENGSAEKMRLNQGGELLINTTTDVGDYRLQVNGKSYFADEVQIASTTDLGNYKLQVTGEAIITAGIRTDAPSGGTAATWKLGTVATVSPTSPNRTIEVEIGGTTYYIHAKTTNN